MRVTAVVCDASVVLKWFHDEGEPGVEDARRLLAGHRSGSITAWVLDLTFYELGNVLLRALRWPAADVADQLDDLRAICSVVAVGAAEQRLAAVLAEEHTLTFYDAVYAAVARSRGSVLATADKALLAAGVGESPATIAASVGLSDLL
jgi:predicted nucleic acid-binding protein